MATSDVTFQDGFKHPYLLALVRWCLSSFWATASVILHRFIAAPLPQIKAPKPPKSRPASYDHLHPEPRVDCEILHAPSNHTLDVIFVHGLYGSLGNTWRQGEWQTKYEKGPTKVPLRRPHSISTCNCTNERETCSSNDKNDDINQSNLHKTTNRLIEPSITNEAKQIVDKHVKDDAYSDIKFNIKKSDTVRQETLENTKIQSIRYNLKKCNNENDNRNAKSDIDFCIASSSIPENDRISEVESDYEIREINVNKELYSNIQKILPKENLFITEKFYNNTLLDDIGSYETQAQFVKDLFKNSVKVKSDCECKECEFDDVNADDCKCGEKCEVGCGCICDECYSPCWPRDWISVDYPGARVISINYTSDPYLWRPLWVKESKRLRLHERAEQMILQLLDLGVGERPIIWVGHSKGGLFIKKIYCDAYEAHIKITKQFLKKETTDKTVESIKNNQLNNVIYRKIEDFNEKTLTDVNLNILNEPNDRVYGSDVNEKCRILAVNNFDVEDRIVENSYVPVGLDKNENKKVVNHNDENDFNGNIPFIGDEKDEVETLTEINEAYLSKLATLWTNSAGFMFYSVPHRGSPLADIKTPITARSIELMEICKDCPLVLSLQDDWAAATATSQPAVRSLVETCRTLMSVLYLRIVSVDSADPGIGALNGVDVDHREICKPSSRSCLLYRELMTLMEIALGAAPAGTGSREFEGC